MAIPFTQIPAALLVPGQYQEVDASAAGAVGEIKRALIIAYRSAAGKAPAGAPLRVMAEDRAASLFGHGSPAALMARAFLELNRVEECHVLPVDAPEAATPWQRTFAVAGTALGAGAAAITVCGRRLDAAAVAQGAAPEAVAAAIVARINGELWVPVEAAANGAEVTVRAVVPGAWGNAITVEVESQADGIVVDAGMPTPGAQEANIRPLLRALGNVRFHYIASDFTDPANVLALADELDDRFTAGRQIGGRAFLALAGELGTASEPDTILGRAAGINNPHLVLLPRGDHPALPGEWSARWCAAAGRILADDPAANTSDLLIPGLAPATFPDADTRQAMLMAGVATFRADSAGNVLAERLVTSFNENSDGGRDTSFLDIQVPETVDAIRSHINAEARRRFGRWKLASTEENFGAGALVMTAGVFRAFLCELYQQEFILRRRWCQDFEGYKNSLVVEVKAGSKTRLEYRHNPNLIGQFLIGAGKLQFV